MTTTTDRELASLTRGAQQSWVRQCRRDLTAWTVEALSPMNQTPARHHQLMLQYLERVAHGEIDRLMILLPPGAAKSSYASHLFPAWLFAQRSHLDLVAASHGSELAENFSRRVQTYIRQNEATLGYGLASENVAEWRTSNGGTYRAVGVGGSLTGRRADIAIIDDPIKDMAEAESPIVRETVWEWYKSVLYTRLKPNAAVVLAMTPWHPDDLRGRLLQAQAAGGDAWTVLKLPAVCESVDDPLGRDIGAALWPEWQSESELARIRANVGEHVWNALYQQDPRPRGGAFFDADDLLVDGAPVPTPAKCDTVFATIDTAIKTGKRHDSTAVVYWAYTALASPKAVILDWDIVQIEGARQAAWLPSVVTRIEQLAKQCGARYGNAGAFIEDKASGMILIQMANNYARQTGTKPVARAIDSKLTSMGKDERALASSSYLIAGEVKITLPAYDRVRQHKGRQGNHLLMQLNDFRLGASDGASDDLIDCFCYGIAIALGNYSGQRKGI